MKKGILSTRQTLPIFRKLLSFLKMCDKGRYAVAPNWRPQMPNMFAFWAIFSCVPATLHILTFLSPLSLPTPPLPFHPAPPLLRGILSYRRQNALNDTNAIPSANMGLLLLSACLDIGLMFVTCPFVHPSVRPFVRCPVTDF